jgi:hypothetical protein
MRWVRKHRRDYILKREREEKHWESQKRWQDRRKAQRKEANSFKLITGFLGGEEVAKDAIIR